MVVDLKEIASQFALFHHIIDIKALGSGNINDTFLVKLTEQSDFVLQRINTKVFTHPEYIMKNIEIFSNYAQKTIKTFPLARRWEIPQILFTQTQQSYYCDKEGFYWRAISYIENSKTFDKIDNKQYAKEMGYALGMFHSLTTKIPIHQLADTLEGFHIAPLYLEYYEKVLQQPSIFSSSDVNFCKNFIQNNKHIALILEEAKYQKKLQVRVIHGDPKANNILLDKDTLKAISIIDFDTLKPGLIQYDIGDCLRSACNPLGEETQLWQQVYFEIDFAEAILENYIELAKDFLTSYDYQYMYASVLVIAFELGLRFFTDYLNNNQYFKVDYPEHNLVRALVQFQLVQSIQQQQDSFLRLVDKFQKA